MKNFIFGIFTLLAFCNASAQVQTFVPWECQTTSTATAVNVQPFTALVVWVAPWENGTRYVSYSIPTSNGTQWVGLGTFGPGKYTSLIEDLDPSTYDYWNSIQTALSFSDDGGQAIFSEIIELNTEPEPELETSFLEQVGSSVVFDVMSRTRTTPAFGWGRNSQWVGLPCSNFVPAIKLIGYDSMDSLVINSITICSPGEVTQTQITTTYSGPTDLVRVHAELVMIDTSDTPEFDPQTVTQTSEFYIQLQGSITTSLENQTQDVFKVYPNPFKDILNVRANRWSIFNTAGQTVAEGFGYTVLSTSHLMPGMYFLKTETESNGKITNSPIMKE